jgi:transposase InsO family protein
MKELGLQANKRVKKYKSYRGECGLVAPNLLNQNFVTERPYEKLGTDVTMFVTRFGRLYLSPVLDFHDREVLSYDLSETPDYGQIRRMLSQLRHDHGEYIIGSILHSDQGYLYQLGTYQRMVKSMGMIQSMSRKGNCLDNSPTENFFGRLKTEMFYGKEDQFTSMKQLKEAIVSYIEYYNEERIVNKLMTSPIKYRKRVMATIG